MSRAEAVAFEEPLDEWFVDEACFGVDELPDWSAADDALVDAQVAAEDARQAAVHPSSVVAEAERAPLTGGLLARLSGVDRGTLDDDGLVGLAVAWTRVLNHAAGQVALAVADYHDRVGPEQVLGPARLTSAEFSAALRLGSGAADRLVHASVALTHELPATLAAVLSGELSWVKATAVADRTAALSREQAREVECRVLAQAAARTPAQHGEALRRAVDRVDPDGAAERRRQALADVALVRSHVGDGMGELFARLPSEQLDTIWTAADAWARRAKAAGATRTLDQLRVAALVDWAEAFLTGRDPGDSDADRDGEPAGPHGNGNGRGDRDGDGEPTDPDPDADADADGAADDAGESDAADSDAAPCPGAGDLADRQRPGRAPTRHGRPVTVRVIWDLPSLLGLTDHPGELADSGAVLDAGTVRGLLDRGLRMRRLVTDPDTGELLDLTPDSYDYPAADGSRRRCPVELHVVIPADLWTTITRGHAAGLGDALTAAPKQVRTMLAAPLTCDGLDNNADDYTPSPALADFVATRDRHPTNPSAGPTAARAADIDHTTPFARGGRTIRANLTTPLRRWHRLRTHSRWQVTNIPGGWQWTSPTGRTYRTRPHDYRHGP